jgi:hypothetical protein
MFILTKILRIFSALTVIWLLLFIEERIRFLSEHLAVSRLIKYLICYRFCSDSTERQVLFSISSPQIDQYDFRYLARVCGTLECKRCFSLMNGSTHVKWTKMLKRNIPHWRSLYSRNVSGILLHTRK